MAHKFISEIEAGQTIDDIYMVSDPILRSTTRGDLYIAMFLSDRTGQANGRMWQASEAVYNSLPKPGFVHINGKSELYQNNLQIIINRVTPIDAGKIELSDFMARTEKNVDQMFKEVKAIVAKIANPTLKALVDVFIADTELMENFCKAPAAVKMHHNYLGGLLEHTHNMLKVAISILPLYGDVNADLVLAGIFLHDMGKTEELSYEMSLAYTDSGQLIGHISKTFLMINQKADALTAKGNKIDKTIIDVLGHIILSHHGQYEFGSPKLPATAEAFMVNYIDDLDAKISQVTKAIDNGPEDSNWTPWQNAIQTRLYRKTFE
ncbi:3'-5' exoribonuclease YhaM family protein [Planctomycetota bacterium]